MVGGCPHVYIEGGPPRSTYTSTTDVTAKGYVPVGTLTISRDGKVHVVWGRFLVVCPGVCVCRWGVPPSIYIGGSPLSIYMGGGGVPLHAYVQYRRGYVPPPRG